MKKKYTIRIERREYFSHDVEVEADNADEAIQNVEERYRNGDFNNEQSLFFSPDDVEDYVYEVTP